MVRRIVMANTQMDFAKSSAIVYITNLSAKKTPRKLFFACMAGQGTRISAFYR